jgi:hypothetical protein
VAQKAYERVLPEGEDLGGQVARHRPAEALVEQLPAQLAPAAPSISGGAELGGKRPVGLVPEDPVCPGLQRRVGPGTDEGPELGPVRAAGPHGTAVVEDLGDLRVGGDEEALGLAPEGVTQAPGVHLGL